ncbi:hypothetical protein B0H12DRAFT_1069777 [Mycena haematopus]|nr:hypothetical protein B0H12DRAFT_1069777 [Mycena haematopus]
MSPRATTSTRADTCSCYVTGSSTIPSRILCGLMNPIPQFGSIPAMRRTSKSVVYLMSRAWKITCVGGNQYLYKRTVINYVVCEIEVGNAQVNREQEADGGHKPRGEREMGASASSSEEAAGHGSHNPKSTKIFYLNVSFNLSLQTKTNRSWGFWEAGHSLKHH